MDRLASSIDRLLGETTLSTSQSRAVIQHVLRAIVITDHIRGEATRERLDLGSHAWQTTQNWSLFGHLRHILIWFCSDHTGRSRLDVLYSPGLLANRCPIEAIDS